MNPQATFRNLESLCNVVKQKEKKKNNNKAQKLQPEMRWSWSVSLDLLLPSLSSSVCPWIEFFSLLGISHCPVATGIFSESRPDVQNIIWSQRAVIISPFITTSAPPLPVSSTLGSSNEVPSVFELLGIKSSKAGWCLGWERHQQGNSSLLYEKQLQL